MVRPYCGTMARSSATGGLHGKQCCDAAETGWLLTSWRLKPAGNRLDRGCDSCGGSSGRLSAGSLEPAQTRNRAGLAPPDEGRISHDFTRCLSGTMVWQYPG